MVIHDMMVRAFCIRRNRLIRAVNDADNSVGMDGMDDMSGGPPSVAGGGPAFPGGGGMPGGAPGGAAPMKPGDGFNSRFCR